MSMDVQTIKKDRLRFTKDSFPATLVILAIVFDCLYFVSIYQSDVGTFYYNWLIGVSIIYNLVFLLAAFLGSESVKNRRPGYSGVLIALGIGQIVRIFILPMMAASAMTKRSDPVLKKVVEVAVMDKSQFAWIVVFLCLSAACCIIAGAVSVIRSRKLAAYNASLEEKAA